MSQAPSITQINKPMKGDALWLFVIVSRSWNAPVDLRLFGSFGVAPVCTENAFLERNACRNTQARVIMLASHISLSCHFKQASVIVPWGPSLLTEFLMLFLGCGLLVQNSKTLESIGLSEQYTPSLKIMNPLRFAARLPVRAPFLLQAQAGETAESSFLISTTPARVDVFPDPEYLFCLGKPRNERGAFSRNEWESFPMEMDQWERTCMVLCNNVRTLLSLSWEEQNAQGSSMLSHSEGTIFTSRPRWPSDNPSRIPTPFPCFKQIPTSGCDINSPNVLFCV